MKASATRGGDAAPPERGERPRRLPRWAWGALALFLAQVLLLALLSPAPPAPAPAADPWRGAFVPAAPDDGADWLAVQAPTLFLLPQEQGFSGDAWLRRPAQAYPAEPHVAEPRPLPPAEARRLAAFPPPAFQRPPPPLPLPAGPAWRLVGAPAGWTLAAAPAPAAPAGEPPAPVRVRVTLDAAGFVATPPVALAGEGPAAQAALAAARSLRFRPPPGTAGRPGQPLAAAEVELHWGGGGAP